MDYQVCLASEDLKEQWLSCRHKLWPECTTEELIEDLQGLLSSTKFRTYFALDGNNKILGFLESYIRPYANGCEQKPVVFIEGIWVDPDARGLGVGKTLVTALEDWAKGQGFSEICSDAYLDNTQSHMAHKSWGFYETERVVYFRKQL